MDPFNIDIEASKINCLYKKMLDTQSISVAVDIGELITRKKLELKHGEFTPWIKDNLVFSERTVQIYVILFKNKDVSLRADSIKRACTAIYKSKIALPSADLKPNEPSAVLTPSADLKSNSDTSAVFDPPPMISTQEKETNLWDVEGIEKYFKEAELPDTPIKTRSGEIINVRIFVDSHLSIIRAQNGKRTYRPYYERLVEFKHNRNGK